MKPTSATTFRSFSYENMIIFIPLQGDAVRKALSIATKLDFVMIPDDVARSRDFSTIITKPYG